MAKNYSVTLQKMMTDNSLEVISTPKELSQIRIETRDVNRPGLMLAGYDGFFDPARLQFLGLSEYGYLNSLPQDQRHKCLEHFMQQKPSCIIITRGLEPPDELIPLAIKYEVPVLRSLDSTSGCMSALIAYLGVQLAERITRHGVLVEVYGEGVLITGDSGVGKSETAVELIKRGHRLIADDAVEIRKVSAISLVGTSPDNIRHFIELRGIGIINAMNIFGAGAVKMTEKIDLVLNLENWDEDKTYNKIGLEEEFTEILGIRVPSATIPVKPGRNLSTIIEVAAMNNRQKRMGYSAAKELLKKLGLEDEEGAASIQYWH